MVGHWKTWGRFLPEFIGDEYVNGIGLGAVCAHVVILYQSTPSADLEKVMKTIWFRSVEAGTASHALNHTHNDAAQHVSGSPCPSCTQSRME